MAEFLGTFIAAVLIASVYCGNTNECVEQTPCLCTLSEYSKIDLTQLISEDTPKKPVFLEDTNFESDITYFFHGCTDATFNPKEQGLPHLNNSVKGSLIRYNATAFNTTEALVSVGSASQIKFSQIKIKDHELAYELVFGDDRKDEENVFATIRLICDNLEKSFVKIDNVNGNHLALISPHVCIQTHHPGMSTGSVLVILFLFAVATYLVCGGLVMYFVRGARGLEVIPNIDFWRGLPGLVRDGIIFLFSGCNANAVTTVETYDRI